MHGVSELRDSFSFEAAIAMVTLNRPLSNRKGEVQSIYHTRVFIEGCPRVRKSATESINEHINPMA